MARLPCSAWLIPAAACVCLTLHANGQSGDTELDGAIAHLSRAFEGLRSIEFKFGVTEQHPKGLGAAAPSPGATTYNSEYAEDAGKFRIGGTFDDPTTGAALAGTDLFNGNKYQQHDPHASSLVVSSRPLSRIPRGAAPCPLWAPFAFAFGEEALMATATLRDPKVWQAVGAQARVKDRVLYEGHPTLVIEVEQSKFKTKSIHTVMLAEDLGYYPLHRETRNEKGALLGTVTVESYRTFASDGGMLVIPLTLSGEDYDRDGSVRGRTYAAIDPASLRVNEPLAEELFTIPPSQVKVFLDMDTAQEATMRGDEAVTRSLTRRRAGWGWWWSLPGVAAVGLAVLVIWWVRQRRAYT